MDHRLEPGSSLQALLDKLPAKQQETIHLAPGVYREKIRIVNDNVTIIGSDATDTIIEYDDYAKKTHSDGKEYNTFRTPTLTIIGNNVTIQNLTVRNSAGHGENIGQAVAMSIYGNDILLKDCILEGYQDTLFLGPLPVDLVERYHDFLPQSELHTKKNKHTFINCTIKGSVDFIFGSASSLFENCRIICLAPGYIAAPSTYADNPVGFVFRNSQIVNQCHSQKVYLARPWRDHGYVYFDHCSFQGNFATERYQDWEKNYYRFYENPYVKTSMSRRLDKERRKQLLISIEKLFPPSPNQKSK
ncbi:MAG: pectin esterase [Bacilli bacterium]|nr:pectin esterase [Bacilli bacterium]MBN2697078.1 pectin esterase [Bacilli bacterium]